MARRAGSLATERTDYSDRRLFPGNVIVVPHPFGRLEDYVFSAHNSLLPPTAKMVALIDPSRNPTDVAGRQLPVWLDEAASAMLETELVHCVRAKSLIENEPVGPILRMALLWGRFADLAITSDQRARADSYERQYYDAAARDVFMESDSDFGRFGYRYGWAATLILERFAESAGVRDVARLAWERAGMVHRQIASDTTDRRVRRAHAHMSAIDAAHAEAIGTVRGRSLVGRTDESVISLRGRVNQGDPHS